MKKFFRNQDGASLVQVMLMASVLAGLALVGTQITTDLKKSSKSSESRSDLESLHTTVVSALQDEDNCTRTLLQCLTETPKRICLGGSGETVIQVNQHYLNQNVKVQAIETKQIDGKDFLSITYARLKKENIKVGFGGVHITKNVPLKYVRENSSIVRCYTDDENDRTEKLTEEFCNELAGGDGTSATSLVKWDPDEKRCKRIQQVCPEGQTFLGTSSTGNIICKEFHEIVDVGQLFNVGPSTTCTNRQSLALYVNNGKISIKCQSGPGPGPGPALPGPGPGPETCSSSCDCPNSFDVCVSGKCENREHNALAGMMAKGDTTCQWLSQGPGIWSCPASGASCFGGGVGGGGGGKNGGSLFQ